MGLAPALEKGLGDARLAMPGSPEKQHHRALARFACSSGAEALNLLAGAK